MKELVETLDKVAGIHSTCEGWHEPADLMDKAAVKWAAHSLATYNGKRLRRALEISAALSEFAMLDRQP